MKVQLNWTEITEAVAVHINAKTGCNASPADVSITVKGGFMTEDGEVSEISDINAEVEANV